MSTKFHSFFGNVKANWKGASDQLWSNLGDFFKPDENLGGHRSIHSTTVQLLRDIVIDEFMTHHKERWELNQDYEIMRGNSHGSAEICVPGSTANQVWTLGWELCKNEVNINNGFVFKYKPEKINGPTYYVVWMNNILYVPHLKVSVGYKFQYDLKNDENDHRTVMVLPPFMEWPYGEWLKYGDENPYSNQNVERADSPDSQYVRNFITEMIFRGFMRLSKHSYEEVEMEKISVTTFKDFLGY